MKIAYLDDRAIDASIVCQFLNRFATWKVHSQPGKWKEILANSCAVISAWDGEKLVGFVRGIGDQVRYAQVLDVLVHPYYRRKGIGRELIARLLSNPAMQVRGVILGTPSMREFYEAVGFRCVNDQAYFMVLVQDEFGADMVQPIE
jgi:ribosomal protein S18 acetylase RimI-like enzyme